MDAEKTDDTDDAMTVAERTVADIAMFLLKHSSDIKYMVAIYRTERGTEVMYTTPCNAMEMIGMARVGQKTIEDMELDDAEEDNHDEVDS